MEIQLDSYGNVVLSKKDSIRLICREDCVRVEQRFMVEFDEIFVEQYILFRQKNVQPYILQSFWTLVDKFWKWSCVNFIRTPKKRSSSDWVEKVQNSMVQQKGLICTKFKNPIKD